MRQKETKRDKLRKWGLPDTFQWGNLRYKHPYTKGILWYWFSLYIRHRDTKQWGTCISCDRPMKAEDADGGHYVAAEKCGRDLLFDEMNVHLECPGCNGFDNTHLFGFTRGLDKRYGKGTADTLQRRYEAYKARSEPVKDHNEKYYAEKALYYKNKVESWTKN